MLNLNRPPLITTGQIYLHDDLNEYLIVTDNNRGQIHYEGAGFKGQAEDLTFIENFKPVNPIDVDEDELAALLCFCPEGTTASTGYIVE